MLEEDTASEIADFEASAAIVVEGTQVRIPVTEGQPLQSGVLTVSGSIPARILAFNHNVPYRDALRKTGYQRKPQTTRINKLKADLRRGVVDVPTAILLNVRGKAGGQLVHKDDHGQSWLEITLKKGNDLDLYVVDGQHRVAAIVALCEEDLEKWGEFGLQFVLMIGATEEQEMRQFYVVNSTAKSVKTDLALDLLKQQYDAVGKIMELTIGAGHKWKVDGQRVVEHLNESSPIWRGKIRLANQEKGDTLIPAASFVSSLKQMVTSHYFGVLTLDQQVRILNAYWAGIREACREPFDGRYDDTGEVLHEPLDYALQKGIGVAAMHELLLTVLEHVRSKGESVFDLQAYRAVMEGVLTNLEGDNKDGEPVQGPDFWLTAPLGGAAGGFSSSAGKRVLQAKLRQQLPEMEAE